MKTLRDTTPHILGRLSLLAALAVAIAVAPVESSASADDALFTVRDVARIRTVLSAELSPDGKRIAYTLSVPRDPFQGEDGPAHVELHVTDPAGHSRPFVTGDVSVSQVQWTPDGKSVAYVAKREGDKFASLYVIPVDGGESRRVLKHAASVHHVRFLPDGRRVVFLSTPPLSSEEQEWRDKGFNQEIYEEDWRHTRVYVATLGSAEPAKALELPGSAMDLAVSRDGKQLAVALAPRPLVDDSYMFKRIRIVDLDTGKITDRVHNPGKLGAFAWSPDGKHLAMISAADLNDPSEGRLMVVPVPGGGTPRDLMPSYQAHVESIAWVDDQTIAYTAAEGVETVVGQVTLEGRVTQRVPRAKAIFQSLSLSGDGDAALVAHTPQHPGEVYLLTKDNELKRLTESNPWLAKKRFANQRVVKWKARDGLELEGILIEPLNRVDGRRYPLILTVHGGPEAHISNGWLTRYSYAGQVGAARGFAVFYPNYRGSTGRGVEFSKLGQADAAGKEFDDLIDAVNHLVDEGLVDRDRVGITGGSYGGYASAWGATYYTEHFAASVMFVGISDNVSKVGTTDIPEEMFLVHHRKRLWEDWEYFLNRSPIRHVTKSHTPTLILHGKEDPRVHPSQSMELYRHLKTLGNAPVRLVFYPGEGHGNRRAASRFDYSVRMLRWMETFLQSPEGRKAKIPDYRIDYAKQ